MVLRVNRHDMARSIVPGGSCNIYNIRDVENDIRSCASSGRYIYNILPSSSSPLLLLFRILDNDTNVATTTTATATTTANGDEYNITGWKSHTPDILYANNNYWSTLIISEYTYIYIYNNIDPTTTTAAARDL